MSYNFDPERWYDDHLTNLERKRRRGDLDDAAFDAALDQLLADYEAMMDRLEGLYRLPIAE